MDNRVDMLVLKGVARPCPDCGEERLFVPADVDHPEVASVELTEYCCTWCGAGLLIDPCPGETARRSRRVA